MEEVICVSNLSKSYSGREVLHAFDLHVNKGEVVGLLGPNGAGKSTCIECMLGTRKKDFGEISILGLNPTKERKRLFQRVGVQFQESNYQREIKVRELCEETAALYNQPENWQQLLTRFGIEEHIEKQVKDLSGGQRQRLFIVLALIPKPEVIFMDELTTELDVKARREVWHILKLLKKEGMTMLLTSHFMDEVEALCDVILILKDGKVIFQGTVQEAIKNSPYEKFEEAYLWCVGEEIKEESDENIF